MFFNKIRGQVSSIDLMVAFIIFILIFVFIRGIWLDNVASGMENFSFSRMQMRGESALDSLIKTPGYPLDWHLSERDIELLGLADKPLVLNPDKVSRFASLDYNSANYLLMLKNYDFNFTLIAPGESFSVSIGIPVPSDSFVSSVKRVVTYNGGEAYVVFKVFGK